MNFNFNWPSAESIGGAVTASGLLPALLVLLLCLAGVRVLMGLFTRVLEKLKVEKTLLTFLRSAVHILLYLLTALIVADKLGIPVTSLIAALSVAGLAISLAVQGALSNIAGGVMILLTKPFVAGDYVEAGDVAGTVDAIGLSYTKFLTPDNKTVFAPNSDIAAAKITNYTNAAQRRLEIKVTAAYASPTEGVKKALLAVTARHAEICNDPPVFAGIFGYNDACIEYVLRAWVPTPDYWTLYFAMLEEIREEFDKDGIEMGYPRMNVILKQ